MEELTEKQAMFAKEYIIDFNGTQAAIRAGYSEKTANEQSSRLLANVKIQKAVQKSIADRKQRVEVTADYVLSTIVETIERCKQAEPVFVRGEPTGEYEYDSGAVLKGAELLGKHLAMFTDKIAGPGEGGAHIFKEVDKAPELNKDEWLIAHGIKPVK